MHELLKIILLSLMFLTIYTYLVYPASIFFLSRVFNQEKLKKENGVSEAIKVTMIVAAHNEEKVIEEKIGNISELDYQKENISIVIASDGSNDRTNEIVARYQSETLKLIKYPRIGKANVLNRTIPLAPGDIVVFSDANTMYNSQAITRLVEHFRDADVGCVCGRLELINPKNVQSGEGVGFYWRYETWIKEAESRFGCVAGANGGIYAIRKKLFEEIPAGVINDDFHISMKIMEKGHKVIYERGAVGIEEVAPDFKSEFSRNVRDGAGHYREIRHLSGLLSPARGMKSFAYISHRLIRWMVPFFLPLIFVTNIFLVNEQAYLVFFVVQICIYVIAVLTFILQKYSIETRFLKIPLFFLATNLALMIGFWKNVFGTQDVTWNSTKR